MRWSGPGKPSSRSPDRRATAGSCGRRETERTMSAANIVVLAGLVIGLVYGAVGLLSGFCMMSSLRGWWAAEGDGRLVRTYALAIGVAVAATQLLAAAG